MTFLFDTICDDLIWKITKNFKWTKAIYKAWDGKDYKIVYHRLTDDLFHTKPDLIYSCFSHHITYEFIDFTDGYMARFFNSSIKHRYLPIRNKIYKYKKGDIWYRYDGEKFKECKAYKKKKNYAPYKKDGIWYRYNGQKFKRQSLDN